VKSNDELLRAARRAFDEALAAGPDNVLLKERRARLEHAAKDLSALRSRLAEVEAAMREPVTDERRMKDLVFARDTLIADIAALEKEGRDL
jgi:predicted  nucleic acid-binding Zn-ribbon protein